VGVFVENLAGESGEEEARLELLEAEARSAVAPELLARLALLMSRAAGRTVVPRLISYGRTEDEQRAILEEVAQAVPGGEVSFDLTHAFRHLGMLGLVSALMLERVGKLKVKGLGLKLQVQHHVDSQQECCHGSVLQPFESGGT
jgi:hypothetical protein